MFYCFLLVGRQSRKHAKNAGGGYHRLRKTLSSELGLDCVRLIPNIDISFSARGEVLTTSCEGEKEFINLLQLKLKKMNHSHKFQQFSFETNFNVHIASLSTTNAITMISTCTGLELTKKCPQSHESFG